MLENVTVSVKLANGELHFWAIQNPTTHFLGTWKSWIVQHLPYGTDFSGAEFGIEFGSC